jgi:CheY-like chemotaxis protein
MLGLCEVLRLEVYGDLNERQLKSVSNIDESGRHLLALINDILDLSKIEAGKLEIHIHPVSVNAVCQASLHFIKQAANKKQLNLTVKLDDANPILQADERRLKQILVNLMSNAVKFTPDNGHVGLKVVSSISQNMVYITVWDSGIGISPDDMKRLFKPFVQLDNSLSRQHTGTGLGLVLVSRMVELHLGNITVESEVGQGSRFTVCFPWQPQLSMLSASTETEVEPLLVIQRVLVVEDSMMMVNQLTRYLNSLNVTNVVHAEGQHALAQARDFQPDVIILDLMLDNISGWEILSSLKNEPMTQHIPVLVVSVLDERPRGLALGAAEYLVKPITQQQLLGALYRAVINKPIIDERVLTTIEPPVAAPLPTEAPMPLILVTEDDENIANLFNDFLWVKGYRIIIARNGKEALKQAALETPDLILMDIQMPEMDGLEAMQRLRAQPQFAFTPIIALTARAMAGDREQCLAAGANDYLSKPVQLQQLAQVIESYLKP